MPSTTFRDKMSTKHPSVSRDYILHAVNLLPASVTISNAVVTVTPTTSPVLSIGTPVINTPDVKVRIGGGLDGTVYLVLFVLTLSDSPAEVEAAIIEIAVDSTGRF